MSSPFVYSQRVEFRDADAAGVAHFSAFFIWMEEAEHAALRNIGTSVVAKRDGITMSWPRVAAKCDYKSPVRFEDLLEVHVSIEKLGTRSVTYRFVFYSGDRELAVGTITTVCCQLVDGKWTSADIPSDIRAKLESLVIAA